MKSFHIQAKGVEAATEPGPGVQFGGVSVENPIRTSLMGFRYPQVSLLSWRGRR